MSKSEYKVFKYKVFHYQPGEFWTEIEYRYEKVAR